VTNDNMVTDNKIDEFRVAVAGLKLKTGRQRVDTVLQVVGAILMVGGFVAGLITYEVSLSQSSSLNLQSEQILAVVWVSVVVIGAALFVCGSLARFLRFWMLRQLYEGQDHVDRLVGSLARTEKLN
jgi:hypothetical protein